MSSAGISGAAIGLALATPVTFCAELIGEWATAELGSAGRSSIADPR